MRVGILTFANTVNYGAMLQCLALSRILRTMGHSVEVLDYECVAVTSREHARLNPSMFRRPKALARHLLEHAAMRGKSAAFDVFRNDFIPLSAQAYTVKNIAEASDHYDVFVTGSDQVWNLKLTGGDLSFFLDFEKDPKKKVAYGASFGSERLDSDAREVVGGLLRQYSEIGIREESGVRIAAQASGRTDIVRTLDPVLLLSPSDWKISLNETRVHRPYVLLYFLRSRGRSLRLARRVARARGMDVVHLTEVPSFDMGVRTPRGVGPVEFLNLVAGASLVITGSFHATVLAALFNRPFVCDVNEIGCNPRIEDFVRLIQISGCIGVSDAACQAALDADWSKVNEVLDTERVKSLLFLRRTLSNVSDESRRGGK